MRAAWKLLWAIAQYVDPPCAQDLLEIFLGIRDISGPQKQASPLEQRVGVLRILFQSRVHHVQRSLILSQRHIRGEKTASRSTIVRFLFVELFKLGQSGIRVTRSRSALSRLRWSTTMSGNGSLPTEGTRASGSRIAEPPAPMQTNCVEIYTSPPRSRSAPLSADRFTS